MMRWIPLLAATALAACNQAETKSADAAAPAAKPASAAPAALPARAPGLWSQTMTMGETKMVSRICLDAAAERQVSLMGQGMGNCQSGPITRTAAGWSFSSRCDMAEAGVVATEGTVSGDFAKAYRVEAKSVTTGAANAQMNGERTMVIEAANQGPCPAGFAPGDVEMPGGMKINILAMAKATP